MYVQGGYSGPRSSATHSVTYSCTGTSTYMRHPQIRWHQDLYSQLEDFAPDRGPPPSMEMSLSSLGSLPHASCSPAPIHPPSIPQSKMSSSEPKFLLSCELSAASAFLLGQCPHFFFMSKCELPNTGHSAVPEGEPPRRHYAHSGEQWGETCKGQAFLGVSGEAGPLLPLTLQFPFPRHIPAFQAQCPRAL